MEGDNADILCCDAEVFGDRSDKINRTNLLLSPVGEMKFQNILIDACCFIIPNNSPSADFFFKGHDVYYKKEFSYATYGFSFMSMLSTQKNRDFFIFENPRIRDEFTPQCQITKANG